MSQLPGSIVVRCFARGTLIQTAEGEVPIEQLAVGTQVITPGSRRPVKWVARQTLHRDPGSSWHPRALPVRIARHAIDDQTPTRDLCVSQEHGILVDGVLIPARHLVNGDTIAFDERALDADAIEYFHVELETHDIIFAEGTAAETFHYEGGMIAWDNLVEYEARYGEHRKMERSIPFMSYDGGLDELRGLLRLAASRVIDVRDPIQRAYDRLAARARLMKRAA